MVLLSFFLGFATCAAVALLLYIRFSKALVWRIVSRGIEVPRMKPQVHDSVVSLQLAVKEMIRKAGDDEKLCIQSANPIITVRLRKKCYSSKADELVVELRNVDDNCEHFEAAKAALRDREIAFVERVTPKIKTPKYIRVHIPVEELTPASVAQVLQTIFRAVCRRGQVVLRSSPSPDTAWTSLYTDTRVFLYGGGLTYGLAGLTWRQNTFCLMPRLSLGYWLLDRHSTNELWAMDGINTREQELPDSHIYQHYWLKADIELSWRIRVVTLSGRIESVLGSKDAIFCHSWSMGCYVRRR